MLPRRIQRLCRDNFFNLIFKGSKRFFFFLLFFFPLSSTLFSFSSICRRMGEKGCYHLQRHFQFAILLQLLLSRFYGLAFFESHTFYHVHKNYLSKRINWVNRLNRPLETIVVPNSLFQDDLRYFGEMKSCLLIDGHLFPADSCYLQVSFPSSLSTRDGFLKVFSILFKHVTYVFQIFAGGVIAI